MLHRLEELKCPIRRSVIHEDQLIVNLRRIPQKRCNRGLCIVLQMVVRLKVDADERVIRLRNARSTLFAIHVEIQYISINDRIFPIGINNRYF